MNNEKKDSDKLKNEAAETDNQFRSLHNFINQPCFMQEFEFVKVETPEEAAVNHPPHYTGGNIECIDAIRSSMTDMEYQGYLRGNILKYLWRFRHKNGTEDLRKAQWYLDKLIEAQGVI